MKTEEGTRVILFGEAEFEEVMACSKAECEALSDSDGQLKREVLAHAGNRWSLGIVHALGVSGTLRHAELARRVGDISQRMLTRSLRQLERDGLIARYDHQKVPRRVDYSLTLLGRGLLIGMMPLWTWVIDNAVNFKVARDGFDKRATED